VALWDVGVGDLWGGWYEHGFADYPLRCCDFER
jgi:hypothetical protein